MRIGFLIDRWDPGRGGAERAMADLALRLAHRGHDVRAFALEGDGPGELHRVRKPIGLSRGSRERALGETLVRAAERERCDVTVGARHLPRVDLYWPHAGGHAASLHGARSARAGRSLPPEAVRATGRHRTFLELERELLDGGGARAVACVSELVRRELAEAYPAARERLRLVPNGVDLERFHPREREHAGAHLRSELGVDAETPLLALSARHPELKGLPVLLEALAGLPDRPWRLLVAGARDPETWTRRARVLGPGRVEVRAEVDPVALAAGADLLVQPTWRDACGLVVLEALASGTPVVTTVRAGAAEVVTERVHGTVLEDPGDVSALREAVAERLGAGLGGPEEREAVRRSVLWRGREGWLASLESIVLDLASRRPV